MIKVLLAVILILGITTPAFAPGIGGGVYGPPIYDSQSLADALSDETGTGAACFATSPTLTTPNIGNATGNIDGNAATATALAANGANCNAGEIPLGVDASGAVESCYEPTEADITDLAHTATAITDGLIVEADLDEDSGTPADEDILTYDSTGANFNWLTPTSDFVMGASTMELNVNVSEFAASVDDTEMTNESFGDFTCTGSEDGCTLNTDSVSANELNATGVEAELEAVLDLNELQGSVNDTQMANEDFGGFTCTGAEDGCTLNGGTECLFFSPKQIECLGTNGCVEEGGLDAAAGTYRTTAAGFDHQTADDYGSVQFEVPKNLTGTTGSATFYWYLFNADCNNGATADVCWTIQGGSFANDDVLISGTLGGTITGVTDKCLANGDLNVATIASFTHGLTAEELGVFSISRDIDAGIAGCGASADYDDLPRFVQLLGLKFCYQTSGVYSGE